MSIYFILIIIYIYIYFFLALVLSDVSLICIWRGFVGENDHILAFPRYPGVRRCEEGAKELLGVSQPHDSKKIKQQNINHFQQPL